MRNRPKVLIVDYQEDFLIVFERLFEDAGFDTTTSWSGMAALKLARADAFDLILVNEHLADMPAEVFVSEVARNGPPCIVMQSGAPRTIDNRRFSSIGAAGVVCKRFPKDVIAEVFARIHSGTPKSAA